MTLAALLSEECEILTYDTVGTDRYGNPVGDWPDWGSGTTVPCRLEQLRREELTTDRATQVAAWRLYLPSGTEITGKDRVRTAEGLMEVDGPPRRMRTPRGEHHVVAYLRQARDTSLGGS